MILEALITANLIISIIGALIVGRWVYALKGTVAAQAATIATIQQVNETVVKVFLALDPERWAKEVTVYKELADRKAAAIVEEAERGFREERTAVQSSYEGAGRNGTPLWGSTRNGHSIHAVGSKEPSGGSDC